MGEDNAPDKQVINTLATRKEDGKWLPGVSGNPNGRPPKGHSITETIQDMMTEKPEIKRALGTKLIQMAIDGDMVAIKTVMAYIDGLPTIKHELVGGAGMQVNFLNYVERDTPALAEDNNKR